tara:strand:+ start:1197 stop:1712 length:516 start_codon:yes stop_codon:yes gene_type:complete
LATLIFAAACTDSPNKTWLYIGTNSSGVYFINQDYFGEGRGWISVFRQGADTFTDLERAQGRRSMTHREMMATSDCDNLSLLIAPQTFSNVRRDDYDSNWIESPRRSDESNYAFFRPNRETVEYAIMDVLCDGFRGPLIEQSEIFDIAGSNVGRLEMLGLFDGNDLNEQLQ